MLLSPTPEKKEDIYSEVRCLRESAKHALDEAHTHDTVLTQYDTEENEMTKAWTKKCILKYRHTKPKGKDEGCFQLE